jgi:serine/threonine protein kinase/FixJ family two-component response regulator
LSERAILIADADEAFNNSLATALRENQFQADFTGTASETLKRVKRQHPDLLILDLGLPDMSGEDLARIFKTDPLLVQIPIIVLTARSDVKTKVRCFDIGVEEYLVKPMEIEELVARINRFFKLMDQWKNNSVPSKAGRKSAIHSTTTADINKRTVPTIHVPADQQEEAYKAVLTAPPVLQKVQKTSYGVYRIDSLAGSGGMGLVYKAHDQSLDRYVAVKVLSKEWTNVPEFATRFRKEAMLIAAINHPGIAQIYTFAEEDGESYFALQWCPGGSLANRIKAQGRLELLPAIDIILQCSRALEAALTKGVVHRDIKPSNLMFDENQALRVVDFGIASSEQMPDRDSSAIVGSPAYMSPEQGRGRKTDHRTDIYSLGITFYQMLYNRLPFLAEGPMQYVEKHTTVPFPSFDDLGGQIPARVYKIIEKMTQKNPVMRYQTYSELIKDLERLRNELYSQRRLKIPAAFQVRPHPDFRASVFFDLLARVFRTEHSGIIKVSWGTLQKRFYVAHNEIVHFESPQKDESCWAMLVNRKLMKKEDVPSESEDLEESLNRLLYQKAFSPEDFKVIWREMMMQSLMQVFLWPVFEGEFFECRIEHDPLVRISLSKVLMEATHSMIPLPAIESSLPPNRFLVRTPDFERRLKLLNLSTNENFLVSRVEGQNISPDTLQMLTGFSPEQISRTIYLLQGCGVLKFEAESATRTRKVPAQKGTTPVIVPEPVQQISSLPEKIEDRPPLDPKLAAQPGKWIDSAPQPDKKIAERNYVRARALFEAGKYNESAKLCSTAIKNNSDNAAYHYLMARILTNFSHSTNAAADSFRQAILLQPSNVEYRLRFVEFLKERVNIEEALEECRKLVELAPLDRDIALLFRRLELER